MILWVAQLRTYTGDFYRVGISYWPPEFSLAIYPSRGISMDKISLYVNLPVWAYMKSDIYVESQFLTVIPDIVEPLLRFLLSIAGCLLL